MTSSIRRAALANRSVFANAVSVSLMSDGRIATASCAASLKQSASSRLVSTGATTNALSAAVRTSQRAGWVIPPTPPVSVPASSSSPRLLPPQRFRRQLRANVAAASLRVGAHALSEATPRSATHSPETSFAAAVSSFAVASSRAEASKPARASRAMQSFDVPPPELISFALRAAASALGATAAALVASVRGIEPRG